MKRTVFYSWQSDLPETTNHRFIQTALENVVDRITKDDSVAIEPVLDRDILGLSGAPDIAATIFTKITASHVFVADVSITCKSPSNRPIPNPNVLVELGYALKCRGFERIILIVNTAFGKLEELPFDFRGRFAVSYSLSPDCEDIAIVQAKLEADLEARLRVALDHSSGGEEEFSNAVVEAIENMKPNRRVLLRKKLSDILQEFDNLQPARHSEDGTACDLMQALEKSQEVIAEYSLICQMISAMEDEESAQEVFKWFSKVISRYSLDTSGRTSNADCDFIKFLGHEMFVTLFAFLLIDERWTIISKLLSQSIFVESASKYSAPQYRHWEYISQHLPLLIDEGRKSNRVSLHADILENRHNEGALGTILSMTDFMSADYFLYFQSVIKDSNQDYPFGAWRSWSIIYLKYSPAFIIHAERKSYADGLSQAFGLPDIPSLKDGILKRAELAGSIFRPQSWWLCPIHKKTIDSIGTRA